MDQNIRKNKNGKKVLRGHFPKEQALQVWKARKEYSWGMGFMPQGEYFDTLPAGKKSLRLDIKNRDEHTPKVREEWQITAHGWRHTENDTDAQGRFIVYIEAFLKQKVIQTETFVPKPLAEAHHETKQVRARAENLATEVIPFRDPGNPDRVLYMEATLVNGKISRKKLQRTGTLENYKTSRAANLRELIEGGLENPYKGSRRTKGVIEKYCNVPLEEIVAIPRFLS